MKTAAFSDKASIVNQRGHLSDPPLLVNVDLSSWELTHIFQLSEQCGKKEIWTDFYRFPQDIRKGKGQQRAMLWSTEVAEPHSGFETTHIWGGCCHWHGRCNPKSCTWKTVLCRRRRGTCSTPSVHSGLPSRALGEKPGLLAGRWAAGKLIWASCPQGIRKTQEARPAEKPLALVGGVQVME